MKLMYAVRGAGPARARVSEALHAGLRSAGVHRLQLNVDDEHVRGARLRLSTHPEPVCAIVGVWTDGEAEPVTGLVTDLLADLVAEPSPQVAGWVVEEAVPVPPPEVQDGRRADALANVALLRIPAGMDPDDWRRRWQDGHTPVAVETQATFGYVQNRVQDRVLHPLTEDDDPVAALVEELFPMAAMTDLHAFYGSGGDEDELRRRMRRMRESTARFGASTNLDLVPTSRYRWRYR